MRVLRERERVKKKRVYTISACNELEQDEICGCGCAQRDNGKALHVVCGLDSIYVCRAFLFLPYLILIEAIHVFAPGHNHHHSTRYILMARSVAK